MLEVKNIKKSFGGVQAIRNSNFLVEKGKVTALIGPNGAGKTTLFDIICGFVKPDSGEVLYKKESLMNHRPDQIINKGISRTFQQVRLFKYLTIADHLKMIENHNDTKIFNNLIQKSNIERQKYKNILEQYGIERKENTQVSELSYGQRKLLDLAMAMHKKHDLLMLDEPVAGVNTKIQEKIENTIISLKEKNETILLIDHDMSFVRKLADHVIVLDAGEVLLEGKPDKVLKDSRVLEAYLGE